MRVIVLNTSILLTMGVFFFFLLSFSHREKRIDPRTDSPIWEQDWNADIFGFLFSAEPIRLCLLLFLLFDFLFSLCWHIWSDKIHFCSYVTNAVEVFFSILPNYNTLNMANNCFQHYFFFPRHAFKWELKIGMQMLITVLIKETPASKVRNPIIKKHDESIWGKHSAADESTNGNFSSIIVLLYIIN